jgi:S-phase kinase-associated protein 1
MINLESQDDDEVPEVPLPNVKAQTLAKVIEFCQHYKGEKMNEIEKVIFDSIYLSI